MKSHDLAVGLGSWRPGAFLATRQTGTVDRERVNALTGGTVRIGVLTLDFIGIAAMTLLYADEFLGRFYTALAAGDVPVGGVQLAGLNEETRYAADVCLTRRRLCGLDGDRQRLLGHTAALDDTYATARRLGEFRASDLADELGLAPTAANNRLARLIQAGALTRLRSDPEHGGREYVYRTLEVRKAAAR